jgi:hypothetical protein
MATFLFHSVNTSLTCLIAERQITGSRTSTDFKFKTASFSEFKG